MTGIIREEQIGPCRLILGDSMEVLPTLPIGCADHCLTDPPYSSTVKAGARTRNDAEFGGDSLVPFSITDSQLMGIFNSVSPIIKRWFVASVDFKHGGQLAILQPEGIMPQGIRFVRAGCWVKTNSAPQFTGDRPAPGWEFVAVMHHARNKMRWNGGGKRGVWTTAIENCNGHPTPKPVQLMAEWCLDFTDEGETVIDPFMGSGTTGVACIRTGRQFIGIEREPKYFDVAVSRIRRAWQDKQSEIKFDEPPKPVQLSLIDEVSP